MINKPRVVEVMNNQIWEDTGEPFGIKRTGILYGDHRFLVADFDGISVWQLEPGSFEIIDGTPCIFEMNLPRIRIPEDVIDFNKVVEMDMYEFIDYLITLEDTLDFK